MSIGAWLWVLQALGQSWPPLSKFQEGKIFEEENEKTKSNRKIFDLRSVVIYYNIRLFLQFR
jgi:hypothetical protein